MAGTALELKLKKRLWLGLLRNDAAAVTAALADGADPETVVMPSERWTCLMFACSQGLAPCVTALYAAGADLNATGACGRTPMALTMAHGRPECMRALVQAGVDPAAADSDGLTLAHHAAASAHHAAASVIAGAFIGVIMDAAPETALLKNKRGELPLAMALRKGRNGPARCLLERGALAPPAQLLAILKSRSSRSIHTNGLHAPLVARQPLSTAEWASVPAPCPGLGAALGAVLARSEAEAAQLVAHLPAADRERLRATALCLRRVERTHGLALPPALVHHFLGVAANGPFYSHPTIGPEGWRSFDVPCPTVPGLYTTND